MQTKHRLLSAALAVFISFSSFLPVQAAAVPTISDVIRANAYIADPNGYNPALEAECVTLNTRGCVSNAYLKDPKLFAALMSYNSRYYSLAGNGKYLSDGYTNDDIINLVVNTFGVSVSQDPYRTIKDTYLRVAGYMHYDISYVSTTTATSVLAGRGVCQDYSVIAYILLNAEGIPTKRCVGMGPSGGYHAWNKCLVNGSWVVLDFTEPVSGALENEWASFGVVRKAYVGKYIES